MRKVLLVSGVLAAVATLQVVVAPGLEVLYVKPDLFLISVILAAMGGGAGRGAVWGFFAGVVQDSLSGGIVGFNLLSKPLTGLTVGLLRSKLDFENPNTQTVVTLVASLGEGLLLSVFLSAYHPAKNAAWSLVDVALPASCYNALMMPLTILAGRTARSLRDEFRRRETRLAE